MNTRKTMIPRPTIASVLRRRKYHVRFHWTMRGLGRRPEGRVETVAAELPGTSATILPQPHPGVQEGVHHVHDDVREHDDEREKDRGPEDKSQVVRLLDGEGQRAADALEPEHLLDDR